MKIVTIVGARPQFIKAAAVSRALAARGGIREVIVHTGQHFDANMSDVFFDEMSIPRPDHHLDVHSLSHGAMTGRMLEGIERVVQQEAPAFVLVYGDTNSTLAGALAARKLQVGVVHVEAGLRSFDNAMPEEINRILTDRISDILYCPTDAAVANLRREGFDHFACRVVQCGDVMEDAARFYAARALERSRILEELGLAGSDYLLCTFHRADNTDDPERLGAIVEALNRLAERRPVVVPLHPRTRAALRERSLELRCRVIPPVGYFDMVNLLSHAALVLTDSGGLQKEAYFFGRHCVILRDQTEWVELVAHGFSELAGADTERIVDAAERMASRPFERTAELYGGGNAADRIAEDLAQYA